MHCHGQEITNPFLQMSTLGVFWVLFHCMPMCGPIVGGLQLASQKNSSMLAIVLYQLGRGLIYITLGGLAGLGGAWMTPQPWYGWIIVGFIFILILSKLIKPSSSINLKFFQKLGKISKSFRGPLRPFFFGILLAFLPCSLALWVLSLAAATASAWKGAAIMGYLIVLTTLPISFSILGGSKIIFRKDGGMIALSVSLIWTSLMTLAASDIISHFSISLQSIGLPFDLMFW